ncbi:MAG: type IV toxin-antitoxin system AbiEi family antitoxin domain-containing protein [Candidatus Saliniplasma sp.]
MEYVKNRNINYSSLSKNEAYLLESIRSEDVLVFGVKEIKALTDWKKTRIYNTLSSMTKKGHIVRIKKDIYTIEDEFYNSKFKVITDAVKPSYISLWTALSYYGFTEQQVNVIQLVSTKQFADFIVRNQNVEISTFKPERFFGYKDIEGAIIAEKEKALVDSLFMLQKSGGLEEYVKCLKNAYDGLDKETFKEYIVKFDNKSLVSRMGFLLDVLDLTDQEYLKKLKGSISKGYVLLDPNGGSVEAHSSDWKIKINRDVEDIR